MVIQHEIQELPTVAALRAVGTQPQNNDKFFCEETNQFYDYDPLLTTPDDGVNVLTLNLFAGRFQAATGTETKRVLPLAGQQVNASNNFANLTGLGVFLPVGQYAIDIVWHFATQGNNRGAAFSVNGPNKNNYSCVTKIIRNSNTETVVATTNYNSGNSSADVFNNSNARATTSVLLTITTAGYLYPTFASENNGNNVTILAGTNITVTRLN